MSILALISGGIKALTAIIGFLDKRQMLDAGEAKNAVKALTIADKAIQKGMAIRRELASLSNDELADRMRRRSGRKKRVSAVSSNRSTRGRG